MTKAIDKILWHDGNVVSVSFLIDERGKATVQIAALFHIDESGSGRVSYQINCEGVSKFNTTLDVAELKDNMFAGNISNGYLKGNALWIYVTDGLIEVHAKKFRVETF
jgi:hypothetical protein